MRLLCVGLILVGSMELAQARSLKLLRSSWTRGVATVGTLAMLALPLPYVDAAPDNKNKEAVVIAQSPQGGVACSVRGVACLISVGIEFTIDFYRG